MGAFDYRNFDDRKKNSASAKQMLLEKFKARPPADDPEMIAKAEARAAIARAREERIREREAARIAAEKAAAEAKRAREEAELAAQIAREEEEARLAAERKAAELIERKAARDARYAARKAKARR
jgi:membrane protein involved in colicin uptake